MCRRTAIKSLLCIALSVAAWPPPPAARAAELSPRPLALMLLRILAYDRNLKTRSGGKQAPIVVLYQEGNQASETMQTDLANALEDLSSSVSVSGLRVKVNAVAYSSAADLDGKLAAERPAALFVCTGLASALPQIVAMSRKRSVLSFTINSEFLKAGLSIGFGRGEDRVNIVVNLPATRAEGADLDAALLRVAEVMR